jgi:hypothetical protein
MIVIDSQQGLIRPLRTNTKQQRESIYTYKFIKLIS